MASYIPFVGTKGRFKFKEPFNQVLKNDNIYKIESLRTFDNLSESGIDVYETVYKKHNLTKEDYNRDLIDGKVVIVELSDEGGKYYNIPSSYILSVPNVTGVLYRNKMLVVDLGFLPDDTNFTELITNTDELVKELLGIKVETNVIDASPTIMVSNQQHKVNEKERLMTIKSEDNVYTRLKHCEDKLKQAKKIINNLELAIEQLASKE
jgi:hypothetical protein